MESKLCAYCETVFYRDDLQQSSWNRKKYCSSACQNKGWRRAHPEKQAEYCRKSAPARVKPMQEYYQRTKDQRLAYARAWREKNPERFKEYQRVYTAKRYATDPLYKLRDNLSSRIRHALKGNKRGHSVTHLLGCSIAECRNHLEQQFTEGMSWENHGEWHIDHIRPMISFDLTDEEQLKAACHYTNLQPLWAVDNIKKGAKY